jgi:hypothetical protein
MVGLGVRHWVLFVAVLVVGVVLWVPLLHRIEIVNQSGRKIVGLEVRSRRGHVVVGDLASGESDNVWFFDGSETGYVFFERVGARRVELGRCWYSSFPRLTPQSVIVHIGERGIDESSCQRKP